MTAAHDHGHALPPGALPLEAALARALALSSALAARHRDARPHLALGPRTVRWNEGDVLELLEPPPAAADAPDWRHAAPEQTGRLEQRPDARSDLYVLGLLLHEWLTGRSPVPVQDVLAQIHWHVAGEPEPVQALRPELPEVLDAIVARLLAKAPEERYQSAAGLQHDLARCAAAWRERRQVEPFALGTRDRAVLPAAPRRLHGREHERQALLQSLEQVCAGARRLVLVEGWSGIGKTALVRELLRPVQQRQGWFVAGKFDQVVRGLPFGGLLQALRALVRLLLACDEAGLAHWRERLAQALGENAGVLAEVLPEITLVLGEQPAPQPLPGLEAQNRLQRVMQQFVAALAPTGRPLVLFLDDLQWADAATLNLLAPLLAEGEGGSLLLLGAYRDHELDASPRLAHTLATLAQAGVPLRRVTLGPLAPADTTALVADLLHEAPARAGPLAQLLHTRSGGNPLFVIRFLHLLAQEGQLRFDEALQSWRADLDSIARAPLADDVLALMTRSIRRLDPAAQATLTLAAAIGNRFDAALLAVVAERPVAQVAHELQAAQAEGLIVADAGAFAFLHDRVQQAAYALIPPERRAATHLSIGRLLRGRSAGEAGLFDIVDHLNRGRALIERVAERREVAALDLAAARRAQASAAHEAALEMLRCGAELLDDTAWREVPALAFELHFELAQSLLVGGQLEAAQAALAALLPRAADALARGRVVQLRSLAFEAAAQYGEALASTREGLQPFGIGWPEDEAAQEDALEAEIARIEALRGGRAIDALIALPRLQDDSVRLVMAMLTDIWSACYLVGRATLARLISATLVRLTLQHGHCEESAYGYVTHAITVGGLRGLSREAYAWGRLALALNTQLDDRRRRAKILQQFHAHVNFWGAPLHEGAAVAREACRAGLDGGDFLYAAYAVGTEPWSVLPLLPELAAFEREYAGHPALIERLKSPPFADSVRLMLAWARALQTLDAGPQALSHGGFDEAAWCERYRGSGFFGAIHAVLRLQLAVLLGTPGQARAAAAHSAALIGHLPGTVWPLAHEFWQAIAQALEGTPEDLPALRAARDAFAARALHCAANFHAQALLLDAEVARLEGRPADSVAQVEAAIEFAAGSAPLRVFEALGHERCAALQSALGRPRLAALHRAAAAAAWRQWGARGKADLLSPAVESDPRGTPTLQPPSPDDGLDLASVLQAAQAIAAEVDVDALLTRLMEIALRNAGAERGALVLETDAGPLVHALDSRRAPGPAAPARPLGAGDEVPAGLVHLVRRTGEPLVLADALADDLYGGDPWVLAQRPRSLLCLPVRHQARRLGVLVLENRHVPGLFTPARLRTMGLIATQAAIALEHARLLAAVEAENQALRRDLIANVSHDLRTPLVSMRGYLELLALRGDTLAEDERRQYLGIALRQCEHLGTLVDELFELARLDFKGLALAREPVALGELAVDVAQKFALAAREQGVQVTVDCAPGVPLVPLDIGLAERVLDNLVANALRHTPRGGEVRLQVTADGQRLRLQVRDSDCGIPPADLPHVFDRFYRGSNTAAAPRSGTGLGLAITRRIVELHGGCIQADSDGEHGSCFTVDWPLAPDTPL